MKKNTVSSYFLLVTCNNLQLYLIIIETYKHFVFSRIVPGISSIYGTPFPYGATHFLRQLQSNDCTNPLFNFRLASSTPDPEKLLTDLSSSRPAGTENSLQQDVPERDISTVSSVPPSFNHVQNMADMVEIYKQIELNKVAQLQEAAAKEAIEKLNAMEINKAAFDEGQSVPGVALAQSRSKDSLEHENTEAASNRESGGFVATGSLGFTLQHAESAFRPVGPVTFDLYSDTQDRLGSSLTAFQPYLSADSNELQPPTNWIRDFENRSDLCEGQGHISVQGHAHIDTQGSAVENPFARNMDPNDSAKPLKFAGSRVTEHGNTQRSQDTMEGKVVFEQQNGMFQIHSKPVDVHSTSVSSDKTDSTTRGPSSLDDVPERDVPVSGSVKTNSDKTQTSQEDTPGPGQKNESQNLSGLTSSTPRTQNISSNTNTSCGGKIVFIPNDSNTPNVIGYVPGISLVTNTGQPTGFSVTKDMAEISAHTGSVISSAVGQQGVSVSHLSSRSGQQGSQDVTGSGYHSLAHAQAVAAGDVGVRKLRYLLKELKECNKVTSK